MPAESLFRDLKIGLRVLIKEKSFCTLAVVVLALGISGVTTMFSVVNAVLLRPLAYRDPAGIAHLFTGDSLFPGGVGNTRGNRRNFESLIGDVEKKLFGRFDDATWFYPGHGKDSTLGAERPSLPEWRARGW